MSRQLSGFRDEHMIETIVAAVSSRERVLAVVGASHVVRQEARLREVIRRRCRR